MKLDEFIYDGSKDIRLKNVKCGAPKDLKEQKDEIRKKTEENVE